MERNNNYIRPQSITSSTSSHKFVSRRADSSTSTTSSGYVGEYERNPIIISSQNVLMSRMARRWSISGASNLNRTRRNLRKHSTDVVLPEYPSVNHPNAQGNIFAKIIKSNWNFCKNMASFNNKIYPNIS